ncbi:dienelactone hydrolase family protein [Roseovarius sp. 2305UL8-3]|uniref:dienelactone hydrolase family protein n=1 Tax=Roseovarius conchicola TaxID=3121636 RepID=UPI003527C62C
MIDNDTTVLTASDGHEFAAYMAKPDGPVRGAIVVVQEIFGVNSHIRSVADGFAADGFFAIAPSLFDRIRPNVQMGYTPEDIQTGIQLKDQQDLEKAMLDCAAAVREGQKAGKVGIVGYCWGGAIAWASAAHIPALGAAVSYYGGGTTEMADLQPQCPVLFHYGELDQKIPLDGVAKLQAAHPDQAFHLYKADHGFNCDQRGSFDAQAARLARERTVTFFAQHLD